MPEFQKYVKKLKFAASNLSNTSESLGLLLTGLLLWRHFHAPKHDAAQN